MSAPGQTTESATGFSLSSTPALPFQFRGIGNSESEHNAAYRLSYARRQILLRRFPSAALRGHHSDSPQNVIRHGSAKNVGAAVKRLRPFGNVANRHIGHAENTGLFLHRSAVRQHADRALFQADEVEEPERLQKRKSRPLQVDSEGRHPRPRARMQGAHHGKSELLMEQRQRIEERPEPALYVHVFGSMQRDQEELAAFQAQLFQGGAGSDLLRKMIDYLLDRVADHMDPVAWETLGQQVLPAAVSVRHQNRARMIDHAAIDFLGDPVVITAVAGLHVIDGDP